MKNNIVLIWMPWSGKSTMWKYLSWVIWYPIIDIDDFIEEKYKKPIWLLLETLWENKFLELERDIVLSLKPNNSIISCTWSIPLKKESIDYLKSIWYIIYIDTHIEKIKERLHKMKVDRIVGMANWRMTLDEVLSYRQSFYDTSFDYRFTNNWISEKKDTFSLFLNYFMKLPFVKEFDIEANNYILNNLLENPHL